MDSGPIKGITPVEGEKNEQLGCPKCGIEMTAKAINATVVDHCPRCAGLWFDRGELDKIVKRGGQDVLETLSATHAEEDVDSNASWKNIWRDEQQGKCPRCEMYMDRITAEGTDSLFIDQCERCKGVWYDGGELHEHLGHRPQKAGLMALFKKIVS